MDLWSALVLLLKAVLAGLTYLQQKGAIDAGRAQEAQAILVAGAEKLRVAMAARAAVSDAPADVVSDPDNRDNRRSDGAV